MDGLIVRMYVVHNQSFRTRARAEVETSDGRLPSDVWVTPSQEPTGLAESGISARHQNNSNALGLVTTATDLSINTHRPLLQQAQLPTSELSLHQSHLHPSPPDPASLPNCPPSPRHPSPSNYANAILLHSSLTSPSSPETPKHCLIQLLESSPIAISGYGARPSWLRCSPGLRR